MKTGALLTAAMLALLPFKGTAQSAVPAQTAPARSVSVLYAGSLVAVMEGPVRNVLRAQYHIQFAGEAKGSRALANLIAAGLRSPDVFVSADAALVKNLERKQLVRCSAVFGSARMVIGYSRKSPHRELFERAASGKMPILDVLADPSVRVGSTDPQLDPKGARTIRVLELLGKHFRSPSKARTVEQKAETFPEEDLAVRVESGEVDAGFFYSTEIPGRDLQTVELPADSNLSRDIAYALAVMKDAPHPQAAQSFAQFILRGPGKALLEKAGVRYYVAGKNCTNTVPSRF